MMRELLIYLHIWYIFELSKDLLSKPFLTESIWLNVSLTWFSDKNISMKWIFNFVLLKEVFFVTDAWFLSENQIKLTFSRKSSVWNGFDRRSLDNSKIYYRWRYINQIWGFLRRTFWDLYLQKRKKISWKI